MVKTLEDYIKEFDTYCKARGWENENIRGLLLSLHIELGELSEHFQWVNDDFSLKRVDRQKVGEEVVDVFNYLIRFISKMDIDFEKVWEEKMKKLETKYPAKLMKSRSGGKKYMQRKTAYRRKGIN